MLNPQGEQGTSIQRYYRIPTDTEKMREVFPVGKLLTSQGRLG